MNSVIRALAEAFWPPLSVQPGTVAAAGKSEVVQAYLSSNGGQYDQVLENVHKVLNQRLYGPCQTKLKLLLQAMAYRFPMLVLAGRYCLSSHWPFVLTLPEMSVAQRQGMLLSWTRSALTDLRQAYKGIKAIFAAVLLSHMDPKTQTNPFFEAIGFVPGNSFQDTAVGPAPPAAAQREELLASATIHLPSVVAAVGDSAAVQAYLHKRGFSTTPPPSTAAAAGGDSSSSSSNSSGIHLFYDAVIVGSGAGGGVTAAVLAAAGLKVLVLEKASWVRSKDMTWMEDQAFEEMYERAGFLITDDGALTMLAGATLGGGTKINWTASLKPPQQVRAEWAAAPHGLTHLGPDSHAFDAALDAVCSKLGVSIGSTLSTPNQKLHDGLTSLGLSVEEYPRNCLSKTCSAYCNMGCRSGHKQSSEVWLVDAVKAGAHILTGVQAQRVLTEPGRKAAAPDSTRPKRAVGVVALVSSSNGVGSAPVQLVVHAPIVVSSCGAVNTPALLLRSGITGGGNVGANLRLHPAVGMVSVFPKSPQQAAAGRGSVEMYKGVSMCTFSRATSHWEEGGYGALISVPACQPGLLAAIAPDSKPGFLKEVLLQLNDAALNVIFTRDSSSGRVRIDRQGRPVVTYWPCATTRQHMIEGIITTTRAMVAAGAVRVVVPNAAEPWDLRLDTNQPPEVQQQQVEAFVRRMQAVGVRKYDLPLFSAHQMGSCNMGTSRRSSACDARGEVWDVSGLYVADGSVFPTPSGVNPMITIYGVSYLTAQGIVSRWKVEQQQQQHQQDGRPG